MTAPEPTHTSKSVRTSIKVRAPEFEFGPDVPRYWLFGSPRATHLVNGLNLLFPLGERFFVRSVRHYQARIDDPQLRADIRGFMAQEVRHGLEHEHFFDRLRAQGYEIDAFLKRYEEIAFGQIERLSPPALRLAVTAALEHYTAVLAERALTENVLDHAHPEMAELLRWHAAEEIEHKAVAFDVLATVAPSWLLRAAGITLGGAMLGTFWIAAIRMLVEQDRAAGRLVPEPDFQQLRERRGELPGVLSRAMLRYLKPGFHPNDHADRALAAKFFAGWSRSVKAAA
ncbi:MAG: metal-dependent hydrolase [Polyangiales bacterium]